MFRPERDNDFHAVYAKLVESVDADPVGMAGVQPKVSVATWSTPTRTRSGPAILKLSPVQYPLFVENEHFFMRMAAACGLRVATTSLIHDAKGHSALLVTRFDRDGSTRVAQEDACQVAGMYPASKYRIKTETAITVLADACARGGGSRAIAILELLKVVVFSWLIETAIFTARTCRYTKPKECGSPHPHTTCSARSLMAPGKIRWRSISTVAPIDSHVRTSSTPPNASAYENAPQHE